jgi:hypothetical protein
MENVVYLAFETPKAAPLAANENGEYVMPEGLTEADKMLVAQLRTRLKNFFLRTRSAERVAAEAEHISTVLKQVRYYQSALTAVVQVLDEFDLVGEQFMADNLDYDVSNGQEAQTGFREIEDEIAVGIVTYTGPASLMVVE